MKQTAKSSALMPRMSMVAIACQLVCMSMSSAYAAEATQTNNDPIDSKQVTITGKKVGMGLMVQENAPKARSTITAEEISKQRPTGNAYEALELMPAVNSYNYDATGLFGGGLTLRGFNSDQIGATINGVPVNDSGNFAVYPQEFIDPENTCTQFVTQGSTDVDSPQIGATGGNFGITTCDPSKERRFRVAQTIGELNMYKTYMRYDTGLWEDGKSRFFISASQAHTDKWKGLGQANRDHVDMGYRTDMDRFNSISATVLMNRAKNNNIYNPSLPELNANGYTYDYSTKIPVRATPTPGKADVDAATPAGAGAYYQLSQNPFQNVIASATAKFRVGEDTDIKIVPYYWYGFGNGGTQQKTKTEAGSFLPAVVDPKTGKTTLVGNVDLNGDGDVKDSVIVATGSVTRTNRPGVTASVTHNFDNHQVLAGFWFERAAHEQFGPMSLVSNDGTAKDIWFTNGRVLRQDGTPYQSRDVKTISTAYQFFAQDTINLMNDKLSVNLGLRAPTMKRDFTNYANEAAPIGYTLSRKYSELLPQLGARYQIDNDNQVFASLAKNMKAPPNFVYQNLPVVNGSPVLANNVKTETSWDLDVGYRLQSDKLTAQLTAYQINFRDRQATAYDPNTQVSSYTNIGTVKTHGFEAELGNTPINGWSFYGSFGYAKSEIQNDLVVSATATLPTAGKNMTLVPERKAGLSVQYETGVWYTRLKAKYTSSQWATMVNDELVPAYTLLGLDAGYQFPNYGWMKKPTLRLNVSNLTNKQYRNPSSFNVTNAVATPTYAKQNVYYYVGAPRFTSVTFSVDY
ncbi:TonB-dependent receptor [Undibacterium sp. Ji67W]|uniref:TonB-dependent receptor n=1 Tax=Undibacterium sp. Ji67W TaxID=3413042 RepID=UPI003BF00A81